MASKAVKAIIQPSPGPVQLATRMIHELMLFFCWEDCSKFVKFSGKWSLIMLPSFKNPEFKPGFWILNSKLNIKAGNLGSKDLLYAFPNDWPHSVGVWISLFLWTFPLCWLCHMALHKTNTYTPITKSFLACRLGWAVLWNWEYSGRLLLYRLKYMGECWNIWNEEAGRNPLWPCMRACSLH